jgi:fatty acid desaturase
MTSTDTTTAIRIVRTRPGGDSKNPTTEYSALLNTVRDLGLLRRRKGFYWAIFGSLLGALGGAVAGTILLGHSWLVLLIAGALGLIFTQFAFLAHEASHRQVFESGKANDRVGRLLANLFVGISYSWWMTKHSRHHANPNTAGKDPDLEPDFVVFQAEDAKKVGRLMALFTRRQGFLFFPLLALEGVNLHIHGFRTVFGRGKVDKRWLEILTLTIRVGAYLTGIFLLLPLGQGFAYLGVQLAVFGIYMGASFAPNHKGMPILPAGSRVDFLRRQVLTSRNIRGRGVGTFMGGLNFQVEHHLFPNMPRPHLRKAREVTKAYCESNGIKYTETTLLRSYGIVVRYLNEVGLSARDPFDCPTAASFGR